MKLLLFIAITILSSCESPSEPTKLPDDLISEVIERDFEPVNEIKTSFTNKENFQIQVDSNNNYEKARFYLNGNCSGEYKEFTKDEIDSGADLKLLQNQENSISAVFMNIDGTGVNSNCKDIAHVTHDNIPPKEIPVPVESMKVLDGKSFKEKNVTMDIREMSIPEGSDKIVLYADPEGKETLTTVTQDDIDRGSINLGIKDNTTTSIYMAYVDQANNIGEISDSVISYIHDDIKPEITTVAQNSIFAPGDVFEGTCKDVEKVQVSSPLNQEVDCIDEKYSFVLPNNEGDFEVTVSAKDDAGNEDTVSVNVLVDGTPPVITSFEPIQKLNGQGTNQNPIQLDLSNYNRPSDVEFIEIYDENSNLLGTILKNDFEAKSYNLTIPNNKTTLFKLVAIDKANNRSEVFNTNTTYTHDNIAPSLTASIDSLVKNNTPITGTCEVGVKLSGDLGYETICNRGTYSLSIGSMSDGLKNVKVTSSDIYGNKTEKELSFTVDNTPPVIYTNNPMFDHGFRTADLNFKLQSYDINFNQDAEKVKICSNDDCSNIISELSASDYRSNGVMLTLVENAQTTFYIELSDILENSKIYGPYIIETDTSVPDAPTLNEETIALATKIVSEDVVKIGGTSPADAIGIDIYLASDLEMPFMGFGTEEWNSSNFDLWPVQNSSTEYVAYAVNDVGTRSATGVSFRVNHATHPMYDYHFSESDLQLGKYFKGMGSPLTFTVQNKSLEINTGLEMSVDVNIAFLPENVDRIESECIGKTVTPNESCTFNVFIKENVEKGEYAEFLDFSMNDMFTSIHISYGVSDLVLANTEFTNYYTDAVRKIKPTINTNASDESIIFYPGDEKICISNTDECYINTEISNSLKNDNFFVYYPIDNKFFFNKTSLRAMDLFTGIESIIGANSPTEIYKDYLGNYVLEKNGEYKTWSPSENSVMPVSDNSDLLLAKKYVNNIDSFVGDYYIGKDVLLNSEGIKTHSFNDIHAQLPNAHKYSSSKVHSILKIDEENILITGVAMGSEVTSAMVTERQPTVGEYYCLYECPAPSPDAYYAYWGYSVSGSEIELSGWDVYWQRFSANSTTTSYNLNGWTWIRGTYKTKLNYGAGDFLVYGVYRTREVFKEITVNLNNLFAVTYNLISGQYEQKNLVELNKDVKSSATILSSLLTEKASLVHVPYTDGTNSYYFINTQTQTFEDFSNFGNLFKPFKSSLGSLFVNSSDMTNSYFISSLGEKTHINLVCNGDSTNVFQVIGNKAYSNTSVHQDSYLCETDLDTGVTKTIPIELGVTSQIYTNDSNEKIAIIKGFDSNNIKIVKLNFETNDYLTVLDYSFENAYQINITNQRMFEFDSKLVELEVKFSDGTKRIYIFDLSEVQ